MNRVFIYASHSLTPVRIFTSSSGQRFYSDLNIGLPWTCLVRVKWKLIIESLRKTLGIPNLDGSFLAIFILHNETDKSYMDIKESSPKLEIILWSVPSFVFTEEYRNGVELTFKFYFQISQTFPLNSKQMPLKESSWISRISWRNDWKFRRLTILFRITWTIFNQKSSIFFRL